jgi:hypothetical protein
MAEWEAAHDGREPADLMGAFLSSTFSDGRKPSFGRLALLILIALLCYSVVREKPLPDVYETCFLAVVGLAASSRWAATSTLRKQKDGTVERSVVRS